jgi:hypothetical protein
MLDFMIQALPVLCILYCSLGSTEDAVTDNSHFFSPYSFYSPFSFSSPSSFYSSSPSSSTLKPIVDMATRCGDSGILYINLLRHRTRMI